MRIADHVRIGAVGSDAVGDAGVVAENSVGDTEGRAGIESGDAGVLPVGEQDFGDAFALAGGNVVNVADGENVALIEIGTGVVAFQVVGVDEIDVLPVGFIVERVRVGVGDGEGQRSDGAAEGNLQRIVIGAGAIFFSGDIAKAGEVGAHQVGVDVAASDVEIILHRSGQSTDSSSIGETSQAIVRVQWNTRGVGILASRSGEQLVEIALIGEISAFAADVSKGADGVLEELVLNGDIPLLGVGPDGFVGNGSDGQGEGEWRTACISQARVAGRLSATGAGDIGLARSEDERSAAFQAFRVGFVAVAVVEENAVAAANGGLAIAPRIPGKTEAGSGIEPVLLQTSARLTGSSALRDAIEEELRIARVGVRQRDVGDRIEQGNGIGIESRSVGCGPCGGIEVKFTIEFLVISAKEAEAHAKVQSEARSDVEVVLNVRLEDFISIVVFDLVVGLGIRGDVAEQQVGKSVAGADRSVGGIKGEGAFDLRRVLLIFLSDDGIGAELQGVFADDLGDVVAQGIGGVSVVPRLVGRVGLEGIGVIPADVNGGEFAAEAVVEERSHGHAGGPLERTDVGQADVVGGIAEDEFIQQRG